MSQTLVPEIGSFDGAEPTSVAARSRAVTWSTPSDDLWVASRSDAAGVHFLGFVERSLETYVAVDGTGAGLGRHASLDEGQHAVLAAHGLSPASPASASWSAVGAPVLTVRDLRAR